MIKRQIEPAMVKYLDEKLKDNGLAQAAIKNKDARLLFQLAAEACVGIQEATGHNDGKMVKLIQETVGGASGEPYCAGGIMTCLAYAELKCGVVSPIPATELAQNIWHLTPKEQRVKYLPLAGAIAVWADVAANGHLKESGHTEIVRSCDGYTFHAVGFNTSGTTSPNSTVNREGNGVYYTVRNMQSSPSRQLLGFVKPF